VKSAVKSAAIRALVVFVCLLCARRSGHAQATGTSRPGEIIPAKPAATAPKGGDPTKGTAVIRGRILLSNGQPARKASVQLASNGPAHATAADENGSYEFKELPADSYYISAGKPGYLVLEYGQKHAFERGDPIELGEGEVRNKVDITLLSSGAVSGRIRDENGDPIENVTVRLFQLQYFSNRRQVVDVSQSGGRRTDDTGAFRIYNVPPGDYIVRASVTDALPGSTTTYGLPVDRAAAELPGYAPTYFSESINPSDAQLVSVGLSEDVQGIDFSLVATPTARLSGRAIDSRNQPVAVILARSQRSSGFAERPIRGLTVGRDGGFRFDNLAPGEYILQTAGQNRPFAEADFAATYVVVGDRDISDIVLNGTSGSTLTGRVTFEGLPAGEKPPPVQITAWPVDFERSPMLPNSIARTRVGDDRRFQLAGLQGPRRISLFQGPSAWQLKSVRANGVDVTDEVLAFGLPRDSLAVEVVLTQQGPSIRGKAVDAQGHDSHDYSVVAFSTDPGRWYQRSRFMATSKGRPDGTFLVSGLAPGEYDVVALNTLINAEGWGEWQDPDFLRKISASATKVTLADGQMASVALQVVQR
jgi:hypothetical protein